MALKNNGRLGDQVWGKMAKVVRISSAKLSFFSKLFVFIYQSSEC
jgi:hypothetical protein